MSNYEVIRARKALSLWDSHLQHDYWAEQEAIYRDLLAEIGLPEEVTFTHSFSLYGLSSSLILDETTVDKWLDFDTALNHPWLEVDRPESASIYNRVDTTIRGVTVSCSVNIAISLPKHYQNTLWAIGRIEYEKPEPRKVLTCSGW